MSGVLSSWETLATKLICASASCCARREKRSRAVAVARIRKRIPREIARFCLGRGAGGFQPSVPLWRTSMRRVPWQSWEGGGGEARIPGPRLSSGGGLRPSGGGLRSRAKRVGLASYNVTDTIRSFDRLADLHHIEKLRWTGQQVGGDLDLIPATVVAEMCTEQVGEHGGSNINSNPPPREATRLQMRLVAPDRC